ncbi:hypothetical protein BDM02DRAFT_994520 [Thelephora ganbajun]|uniref:Uncharacterized protein n=1 Tax=Thelephora ganbajun TaxID=370292 RepID=A0ACB6Z456_THEGA|nr:hypothetical protein BDM02DRAFT_994520 [Thelephora ganbajun]
MSLVLFPMSLVCFAPLTLFLSNIQCSFTDLSTTGVTQTGVPRRVISRGSSGTPLRYPSGLSSMPSVSDERYFGLWSSPFAGLIAGFSAYPLFKARCSTIKQQNWTSAAFFGCSKRRWTKPSRTSPYRDDFGEISFYFSMQQSSSTTGEGCSSEYPNDIYSMGSDGKARPGQLFNLIVREYETISPNGLHTDRSKDKATIALLPYAARREENGAVLPISLMYATLDAVQYEHWPLVHASNIGPVTRLWMTAASEVPYTDDIGQSVVDALLQVAWIDQWLSHIPALAWDWLKKRPVLPAHCEGLKWGTHSNLIQMVRNLRDAEVIASYLFVVWSEWTDLDTEGCSAMMAMIREELCGIEAVGYRADLIQRLDYVLSQLDTESYKKQQYEEFRTALLEVDEEATKTLTGYHSTFMCAIPLPCP